MTTARDALRSEPAMTFVARTEPPGFRDLASPEAAGASTPLTLLPAGAALAPAGGVCAALFADTEDPRIGSGATPAVFFTDYRCPYCRVLGPMLVERAEAGKITLIVKEWPILGPPSEAAARMALAASRQDAYLPTHDRLMQTPFVPTEAYGVELARGLGIDPDRMLADMNGPAITAQLERNAGLAASLGFRGTPGLVVGRTVATRSLRAPELDALISAEDRVGPVPC